MDMVKKLDVDVNPEVHAKVYQLTNADANLVATQLNKMFEQPQGSSTPVSPFLVVAAEIRIKLRVVRQVTRV